MQLDIGLILITAALGGLLGGVGGLIGYQVEKRFPARAQPITMICTIAGSALALALAPIVTSSLNGEARDEPILDQFDRELRAASKLFVTIAEGWPSEYRNFLSTIAADDGGMDQAAADRLANAFTTDLRKSNADLAQYSDDAGLRAYFRGYQAFLLDLKTRDDDQLCAAILVQGVAALGDRSDEYLAHIEHLSDATMKLLLDGRARRDEGEMPVLQSADADIYAFEAFLLDRTGEEGLLSRVTSGTGPDLCSAGIRVIEALSAFAPDQPQGRAMRSTTFFNIVSV